jgi:hypothetical protein
MQIVSKSIALFLFWHLWEHAQLVDRLRDICKRESMRTDPRALSSKHRACVCVCVFVCVYVCVRPCIACSVCVCPCVDARFIELRIIRVYVVLLAMLWCCCCCLLMSCAMCVHVQVYVSC